MENHVGTLPFWICLLQRAHGCRLAKQVVRCLHFSQLSELQNHLDKQTMPTPLPALATDFAHGKIYRHPYCKRALYRLIDARVTCPIQRAKTPDSLCYIICLVGKVLSVENTALPQFNVAASPHPTWLYKSWRMFAGKLR